MKFDSQSLWEKFKNSLVENIKQTDVSSFEKAWKSRADRTEFYFNSLLPGIREKIGLEFTKEKPFRVDGIFWKKAGQTTEVPVIYLESENSPTESYAEVLKLCCLNAPLKVLMVCTEWSNQEWRRELIESYWYYIIEDFKDEIGLKGYLAFIIADGRGETLKFHSYVVNEEGDISEDCELAEIRFD